ncbi:probable G-protein coupled receptor 139 [Stegostoma tigrinum]|uniref:probable G-protein coupled receptor 139 n=1 Tax=Stegostoma tigrinum TaxID=3053191 RepID=UPI00286FC569|nr:probable G-protein coupled receptor 139 [Stegostoma tigrinum]
MEKRYLFEFQIYIFLFKAEKIYYPLLAAITIPMNILTIFILIHGKCGLSKCITCYLVAMAAADMFVVIIDVILRQIPIVYEEQFIFMYSLPLCNIHAVLLYAVTDCSIWFTVTFTMDRFIAICYQKLTTKYCRQKTVIIILGAVTILSCLKNVVWYFMFTGQYWLSNAPWFCEVKMHVLQSRIWGTIELLHHILTPFVPFILILLLNVLTVKYIVVASKARKRLRNHNNSPKDPQMESRRKSMILLFVISGNFILLWSMFMVYSIWSRMWEMGYRSIYLPYFVQELGFMMQLLSCCTNTCIYVVTQTKFRDQMKKAMKYPFFLIRKAINL